MPSHDFKELAETTETGKVIALNAYYMCKEWGGRPVDDLYPENDDPNFRFSLNSFVLQVGSKHENEKQKRENKESTWGRRR